MGRELLLNWHQHLPSWFSCFKMPGKVHASHMTQKDDADWLTVHTTCVSCGQTLPISFPPDAVDHDGLLYWLSKPKGANLVEASIPAGNTNMALAYRSMAIAVSGEMLYKDKCPLVGVGLVYIPPYLPRIAFSAAYMHLNEWHSATSEEASEDRLVGTGSFPWQTSTPFCWMRCPQRW